ncbi:MAG: hypothetical protein JRH16_02585 [Deltaproteobacteria bacterium]|nr:hypothetical protein [Deltaproteobacteria bacterium]MBW2363086.1 hypothetical protein [Deltaproteobacteria bacterium]
MKGNLSAVGRILTAHFASKYARVLVLIASAMCFASATLAADEGSGTSSPILGTWRLNLEESIPPQGTTFEPFVVVVGRADSVIDFAFTATGPDGQEHTFSYGGPADGAVRELPSSGSRAGMKGAMIRLPSGSYESRLWSTSGRYENKFCQVVAGGQRQVCLATLTYPDETVTFFKQVLDRVVTDH